MMLLMFLQRSLGAGHIRLMADRKNMTLRLPAEQADELEAVARAEEISVSHAVREAITEHIARKR